jgi:hypothetical protein
MNSVLRQGTGSFFNVASLFVAGFASLFATLALYKANSVGKKVPPNLPDQLASLKADFANASAAADKANKDIVSLTRSTQSAFDSVGPQIGILKQRVQQLADLIATTSQPAETPASGTVTPQQLRGAATRYLSGKNRTAPGPNVGAIADLGSGHWIQTNVDSGGIVILEDGSLWKIDPMDKVDAALWLETTEITVIESDDGSPGYDYLLINTDDSEKAHAKYLGQK